MIRLYVMAFLTELRSYDAVASGVKRDLADAEVLIRATRGMIRCLFRGMEIGVPN